MFRYTKEEYSRFRNHSCRYLLLLSVLYFFLYCIRLNLFNAGAEMMEGLGWSKVDVGILTAIYPMGTERCLVSSNSDRGEFCFRRLKLCKV